MSDNGKKVERHLQIKKVANLLDCQKSHIYHLIQVGELKAIKIGSQALRIEEKSLSNFITRRKVKSTERF